MLLPSPWKVLVAALAGNGAREIDWSRLAATSAESIDDLLALSTTRPSEWSREIALVALWRSVLSVLPAVAIENPASPCKELVRERLSRLLGAEPPEAELTAVIRVIKRIQRYQRLGRSGMAVRSLDLELVSHVELLRTQSHRCKACGYRFSLGDLEPDESSGELPAIEGPVNARDRSPRRMGRRAVLDHILPVYLAEDISDNWQVLCETCNRGKSDLIVGIEGRAWFGGARLSDLTRVTPTLFFMILSRDRMCANCGRMPSQAELRVARKDETGADLYTNLKAICRGCLGR